MSGSTQTNLGAFDEQSTDSTNSAERSEKTSTAKTPSDGENHRHNHRQSTPATELYIDLAERICREVPRGVHEMVGVTSLSPPEQVTTTSLPDEIPALPKRVGNWTLIEVGEDQVRYHVTGKAYDKRYGNGGGNQEVELYFNDSGVNKDNQYHLRNQNIIGFENGAKIRSFTPDKGEALSSCQWFSPSQNTGDRGVSSGSSEKFDSYYEAVLSVLQYLHFTPAPFGRFLPTDLNTEWQLQKLEPLYAKYRAALPDSDKEYISLMTKGSAVKVRAYNEADSTRDVWKGPVPSAHCEYSDAVSHTARKTDTTTAAVAVQATIQTLQENPQDVFSRTVFKD